MTNAYAIFREKKSLDTNFLMLNSYKTEVIVQGPNHIRPIIQQHS